MFERLKKFFSHDKDIVDFKESHYSCVINGEMSWYDTKKEMLDFIERYSKSNVIYSLSMFKYDMYNLIK